MNTPLYSCLSGALLFLSLPTAAPAQTASATAVETDLKAKAAESINRGLDYLKKQQKPEGFWSSQDYPGLTALVAQAFILAPGDHRKDPEVVKAFDFIRKHAQKDGSIHSGRMSIYNTSICLAALLRNGDPKDRVIIDGAHQFLTRGQTKGSPGGTADGGFGYEAGGKGRGSKADLDNTVFTMEALTLYKEVQKSQDLPAGQQLNWEAAISFVSRCQQLPGSNKQKWVSDSPDEKGGFVYQPDPESGDGSGGPPRSYGTMTYAGLLSFIYADVKADDARVKAAKEWIERHYTVEENPGQGAQGLYYYYHMMAKGLTAAGIKSLKTQDGKAVDWKTELTAKLLSLQKPDGSWASPNGRWMEKDPNLVTTYCLLALDQLASGK
jgi:squalene-hopene/tetraprenyl-beta-curcumene cyclase